MSNRDETFEIIARELQSNTMSYESGATKHMTYVAKVDAIFSNYGWTKKDFYAELNRRLGRVENEVKVKKTKTTTPPTPKKIKVVEGDEF